MDTALAKIIEKHEGLLLILIRVGCLHDLVLLPSSAFLFILIHDASMGKHEGNA